MASTTITTTSPLGTAGSSLAQAVPVVGGAISAVLGLFGKKHYLYNLWVWDEASYKWILYEQIYDPDAIKAHAKTLNSQGKQTVINHDAPAPAPLKTGTAPATKTKWLIYAGIGAVVLVFIFLLLKRRK